MKKFVPQTLAASILLFVFAVTGVAQTKSAKIASKAGAQPQAEQVSDLQKFRQEFIKAAEEYRASLNELSASYESSQKRAAEQHEKLKDLYKDGLIARIEYEASEKQLADAAAKVEDVRREIAKADETLVAARKPIEAIAAPADVFAARANVAWTTGNRTIDNLIRMNANRYGVDPYLIYCVMHQESGFRAGATSHAGASGLMQLMPGTAARYGVSNIYDPAQNIQGGTRYLADLLRLFRGRVDLALAGYNAGEGAVMKYGNRIPPYRETQNYVRVIGSRYAQSGGTGLTTTSKTSTPAAKRK